MGKVNQATKMMSVCKYDQKVCVFVFFKCFYNIKKQGIVLYKGLVQLACDSMLGKKPSGNLANMRAESITRPRRLIPAPSAPSSGQ